MITKSKAIKDTHKNLIESNLYEKKSLETLFDAKIEGAVSSGEFEVYIATSLHSYGEYRDENLDFVIQKFLDEGYKVIRDTNKYNITIAWHELGSKS